MKLLAVAAWVTCALFCVSGCAAARPLPRAASTPREPTLLPEVAQATCDAGTLARASLWAGSIIARAPLVLPASGQRVVYDRAVRCERLDLEACRSWARRQVDHVLVETPEPVERRIETGSDERGTMWSLLVDGEREGRLLRTNREFAQTFRELAAAGKQVQVTDRQRVTEPRFARLHMRVVAPPAASVPAERWTIEFDASEMAVVELGLALDDLERSGIRVSDRRDLESRAWAITPIASTAFLSTPLREESRGREHADVVVSCDSR